MANLAFQVTNFAFQGAGQFAYQGSIDGAVVSTVQTPAGRKHTRRWVLEVNGKDVIFSSIESLFAFLSTQTQVIEREAVIKGEEDAKRIILLGKAQVKIEPPLVLISSPIEEARDYIAEIIRKIDKAYRNSLTSELARQAQDDDDIAIICTFL